MPVVDLEIANELSMVVAVRKMDHILTTARSEEGNLLSGMAFDRQGNVFVVSGTIRNTKVSGRITMLDRMVKINLTLPVTAIAYQGAAERTIREYLESRLI
ncbi:MAG: hypothetical protein H7840_07945 [Alphaproteobacteria bacterium]